VVHGHLIKTTGVILGNLSGGERKRGGGAQEPSALDGEWVYERDAARAVTLFV
jgi:hypothetical protein